MGRKNLRSGLVALLCVAGCVGALASCVGEPVEDRPIPYFPPIEEDELPVIGAYVGTWDGENLTFQPVDEYVGDLAEERGVAVEELLDLSAMSFGGGSSGTGTNYVALEQVAGTRRTITNGAQGTSGWNPTGECGGTPSSGVCVQVRARNMYTNQLERVYVELVSLNPTGSTTAVNVPVGAEAWTGVQDFDLVTPVMNGLWRYGTIGRSSAAGAGVTLRWAFHGTTTGTSLTFTFLARVRGLIVNETERASLSSGVTDDPQAGYPARAAQTAFTSQAVSMSQDGQYVVFVTTSAALSGVAGQHVVRRNMVTGVTELVNVPDVGGLPAGSCNAQNPHVSADGNVVVFAAFGPACALAGGATSTVPQVYLRDMSGGTTVLVSQNSSGAFFDSASREARVSGDGNVVVFESAATNVDGHPGLSRGAGCREIYRFDRTSGLAPQHVSVLRDSNFYDPSDGWAGACNGSTLVPGISADLNGDGNFVVFLSRQQLDPADPDTIQDVYVYDFATSQGGTALVYRVSLTEAGAAFSGGSAGTNHATISSDGSTIAFTSDHTNVVSPGTTSGRRHIYTRTSAEGAAAIRLVSRTSTGIEGSQSSGATPWPALSASGRFVAFWSAATNLASPYSVTGTQLYVCDTGAAATSLSRCWVASTIQVMSTSGFVNFAGTPAVTQRIGLAMNSDDAAGYVAYQGTVSGWGNLSGANQVYVSPVGDPRFQQGAVVGP